MKRMIAIGLLAAGFLTMTTSGVSAAPIVIGSVGGAPIGAIRDNLDWLIPYSVGPGHVSPVTGITVNFFPDGMAFLGTVNKYAAPYLSGGNGQGFGSPNQPDGLDGTTYIASGSTTHDPAAGAEILLGSYYKYFGLLWGSVDDYNTLSFYDGGSLLFSVTGAQVSASPNGDQGLFGTLYVNIVNDVPFNRVVATSSNYNFEIDNLAFSLDDPPPVPEPASILLFGAGLAGLAGAVRRRTRK